MYSTDVLLFTPRQDVVLIVGNSPRRYQNVYAKTLTLHRGVDNRLQFRFLDQEQKPVDIRNVDITCRLISSDGNTQLLEKVLVTDSTLSFPAKGLAELQITANDLDNVDTQYCYYTLQIPSESFDVPVFVDSQAGGRGKINIVDSILPNFQPSIVLNMEGSRADPNFYYSETYYPSDVLDHTLQLQLTDYTGTVDVEGLDDTNTVFVLDTLTYDGFTGNDWLNLQILLPKIRFKFNSTATPDTTDKVLVR